ASEWSAYQAQGPGRGAGAWEVLPSWVGLGQDNACRLHPCWNPWALAISARAPLPRPRSFASSSTWARRRVALKPLVVRPLVLAGLMLAYDVTVGRGARDRLTNTMVIRR